METFDAPLGMEELQLLTDQQKQNYMDLVRLFEQPGWVLFKNWAEGCLEEAKGRVLTASSWDTVNSERGAGRAFASVINIENATELDYRILADEAKYAVTHPEAAEGELE